MRRRLTVASLAAVLAGVVAVPALAVEFHTGWGDAVVDDNSFLHPSTGDLLPLTQAWPRGQIRDAVQDGHDVRLRVLAFNSSGGKIDEYTVTEGEYQYVSINHLFDVAQPIAYLGFDFCRTDNVCIPRFYIGRPSATPTPTPTPTTQPGPTPTATATPAPDRDGDGFAPPADCDDRNSTVRPGGREIAGNGIDDDCDGVDKPGKILSPVPYDWTGTRAGARLDKLRVTDVPQGASVEVRCAGGRGKGCPFARRAVALKPDGSANLIKLFPKPFRKGAVLEVWLTAPNSIGKVVRFVVDRGRHKRPRGRTLCLQPGAAKPAKC
jgi:hypothetical protein